MDCEKRALPFFAQLNIRPAIPPELKEAFLRSQLQRNLCRLKISSYAMQVLSVCMIVQEMISLPEHRSWIPIAGYLALFIVSGVSRCAAYYSAKREGGDKIQWFLCYALVIVYCLIMGVTIDAHGLDSTVIFSFIHRVYFLALVPEFKPKHTLVILNAYTLLLLVALYGHDGRNPDLFMEVATILEFLCVAMITNLVMYTRRVKIFVKTAELEKSNQELAALSLADPLTGLPNRRAFKEMIGILWAQCRRLRAPITLVMIDVDYFKNYNDEMGHLEGDKVLRAIADCMQRHLKRETDFIARFGGEEFVCILPYIDEEESMAFINELLQRVEEMQVPHPASENANHVTLSAGLSATIPTKTNTYTSFLEKADKALYLAKETGRNRVIVAAHDPEECQEAVLSGTGMVWQEET